MLGHWYTLLLARLGLGPAPREVVRLYSPIATTVALASPIATTVALASPIVTAITLDSPLDELEAP